MPQNCYECGTCDRWFGSYQAREQHMRALGHEAPYFECDTCDRAFPTRRQVEDHMDSKDHWYQSDETESIESYDDYDFCMCGTCGRWFGSFESRDQHMNALNHVRPEFECDTCERFFPTRRQVDDHMNSKDHWSNYGNETAIEYPCRLFQCYHIAATEEDRNQHEAYAHDFCGDCHRFFNNGNNAWMHRNSKLHRGTPIRCPFCHEYYSAATALCQHLEKGGCPKLPNLTREQIYQVVRSKDPKGIITKNLIGWHSSVSITYYANESAWNGWAYECYLCHKTFGQIESLNRHLGSSAHQQALYHCPNRDCGKDFTTLAGLMNHLESESCGFIRFSSVQRTATDIVSGNRQIRFG
ncbi:hypothetical protein PG995_011080 [Apiospora arundinis]|uniref:PR domain zinc finger protein 16 n=1 Tax=Apiospora arundinis TaxID=335852 RepID=A0ABR2IVB6_9PEZI